MDSDHHQSLSDARSKRRFLPLRSHCTLDWRFWEIREMHCAECMHSPHSVYITCNSPLLLLCPSLCRILYHPPRVLCLHSIKSHVILSSWCRTSLSYVLWCDELKAEFPSGIIEHMQLWISIAFLLHRNPWGFIIKQEVTASLYILFIIPCCIHTRRRRG